MSSVPSPSPRLFPWITPPPPGTPAVLPPNDGLVTPSGRARFFTPEECGGIRALAESLGMKVASTSDGANAVSYSHRRSQVRTVHHDSTTAWIFDRLEQAVSALMPHFRFEVVGFFEGAQIYQYPTGGFLDWHMDIGLRHMSCRKLSITVQLSDDDEYEGGDLEFMSIQQPMPRPLGTVVVFPSYLQHRVTRVTKGSRWSLVSWVHGMPFR